MNADSRVPLSFLNQHMKLLDLSYVRKLFAQNLN